MGSQRVHQFNHLDKELSDDVDLNEEDGLLSGSVDLENGHSSSRVSKARSFFCLRNLGHALTVLLAIWGSVDLSLRFVHHMAKSYNARVTDEISPCFCGYTIAEAKSLGCQYDSLAAAWLPPHCRDDEVTEEFERSGPGPNGSWIYWADSAHTQELSLYEVSLYADRQPELFHTSVEWHRKHCIWSWLKEHRSKFNGITYDPRSDTEAHVRHCGKMLLEESNGTTSGVVLIS